MTSNPDPIPIGDVPPNSSPENKKIVQSRRFARLSYLLLLAGIVVISLVSLPLLFSGDYRWYTGITILILTQTLLLGLIILLIRQFEEREGLMAQLAFRLERKLNRLLEERGIDPDSI